MSSGNVRVGDWFTNRDGRLFIKVEPFLMGDCYYQAVNLLTGRLAFPTRLSVAGPHVVSDDSMDISVIDKPSMITSFSQ